MWGAYKPRATRNHWCPAEHGLQLPATRGLLLPLCGGARHGASPRNTSAHHIPGRRRTRHPGSDGVTTLRQRLDRQGQRQPRSPHGVWDARGWECARGHTPPQNHRALLGLPRLRGPLTVQKCCSPKPILEWLSKGGNSQQLRPLEEKRTLPSLQV